MYVLTTMEFNSKSITKCCLHFKNIIQHTSLVKEEIIKETRKYYKLNDIGNTTNL